MRISTNLIYVYPTDAVYMEDWVKEIVQSEKKKRGSALEAKIRNGIPYLYTDTTVWDKQAKKRRKISKYIGRITRTGIIEANTVKYPARTIYEYANGKLLHNIINDFAPTLEKEFPYDYTEIIAAAIVRLLEPTPIKLLKSRWEKLYLSKTINASLSHQTASEKLRRIGADWVAQRRFFGTLIQKSRLLLFDLSSIFSYSENLNLAERGHNADHMYLDQINFVLMFSHDQKLPVMLKPLPGSVRDIKALKNVLDEFDFRNCIWVLDRGFADTALPGIFVDDAMNIILPLRRNFSMIDYTVEFTGSFTYAGRGVKWTKSKVEEKVLYLFEDVKLRGEEETTYIGLVEKNKRTVVEMEAASQRFGKIALLSNMDTDGREIYLLFKSREDVEQAFDAFKNELENDKTYLSDADAVRGYFFISFVSLYLYYRVYNILRAHDKIGKISVNELTSELSKVYAVEYPNNQILLTEIPAKVAALDKELELNLFPARNLYPTKPAS
jgi:transposase